MSETQITGEQVQWVNEDRTVLVRCWPDGTMEVATRDESGAIWGPPVRVELELS